MHTWSFFIIHQVRSQRNFLICLCTWAILEHCMWSVAWRHKGGLRSLPWTRPLGSTRNLWWVKYRIISEKRCVTQRTVTCVGYFPLPRFVFIPSRNAPFRDETKPAVSHPRRTRGSQSSREKSRRDESVSSTGARTPGYRLSHGQANANSWLGTKNALYYFVLAGEERSSW